MPKFDNLTILSNHQAITATAGSTVDFLCPKSMMDPAGPVQGIFIQVTEAFNTLTSLNFVIQRTTEADSVWASPQNTIIVTVPLASLVVGYQSIIRYLPELRSPRMRMYYQVTGSNPTTGKIFAALVSGFDMPFTDGKYVSPRNPSGAASTA